MLYSQAWLENPAAIRAIFVEATRYNVSTTSEESVYLSTTAYVTDSADVIFDPILAGNIGLSESMSTSGGLSFSFGDIEIQDVSGALDSWLDSTQYIWVNRPIKLYLGDPQWTTTNLASFKTDFLKIFDGLISDISSKSVTSISLVIRDKMERLNTPVYEAKLGTYGTWGGGQSNQDTVKPMVFGEVFNMEPLLIDPSLLKYMFNDGPAELVIELRDNGVPIYTAPGITSGLTTGATVDLSTGTFTLAHPLAGTLTMSAQGSKRTISLIDGSESATYTNTVANLIALITMKFGKSYTQLASTDIDLSNFAAAAGITSQPVGVLVNSGDNVLSLCQSLAASIGAQLYFNRVGQLQLLRLGGGTTGPNINTITPSDILFNSLTISSREPVVAASKLGYAKNWTVQTGLITGIPEQHKLNFATEYYTQTSTDSTVQALYKLTADPVEKDTLMLVDSDALTEAARLKTYYSVPKTIYRMTGKANCLGLQLGQNVTLIHDRFNLYNGGAGRAGQVYSLNPDWLNATVTVEVII